MMNQNMKLLCAKVLSTPKFRRATGVDKTRAATRVTQKICFDMWMLVGRRVGLELFCVFIQRRW